MTRIDAPKLDDARETWMVYADALQEAGDPRGELIVLNEAVAGGASVADRDALLERHADAIFGSLAPVRDKVSVQWKYCIPVKLTLGVGPGDDAADLVGKVLESALGAAMRSLRLVGTTPTVSDEVDLSGGIALLSSGLPRSCVGLELIDERAEKARILVSSDYDPGENLVSFGSLDEVWTIRHLESLRLQVADPGQIALGTIDGPELRDFALLGLRWANPYDAQSDMARALAAAAWPKLERLALRLPETLTYSWPSQQGAYVPDERYDEEPPYEHYLDDEGWREEMNWSGELGGLLESLKKTPLVRLSLTSFASPTTLLEALQEHGLPSTLRELDLSESDLANEHVAWLAEHEALLSGLEKLDLSGTLIESVDALANLGPEIIHTPGEGAVHRFSVGME